MRVARQGSSLARAVRRGAAGLLVLLVGLLVADYLRARAQAPADAAAIARLQEDAQSDRAVAAMLAAEQARVTRTREGRKRRDDAVAILAIAAAALFVGSEKWRTAADRRRPQSLPLGAIRIELAAAVPKAAAVAVAVEAVTAIDLSFVDRVVAAEGDSPEAAIPILQAIQAHYRYLPDEALRRVCELTRVTPAQLAGTSSFYSRFRRSPVGDHIIRVCHGTACHVSGARQITEELRRHLHIPEGADTDPSRRFTLDEVACLGCCSLAPVLMVDDQTAGRLTPATAVASLDLARETETA